MGPRVEGRHHLSASILFSVADYTGKRDKTSYNLLPSTRFLMKELLICSSSRHLFSLLSCCNRRETGGGRQLDPAVYQAMMGVIAEKGWSQATMPEIAARSLTALEEIQRFYPTLHDLLAAYLDEQTRQLLAQPAAQLLPDAPLSATVNICLP